MTVLGPLEPKALGHCQVHEHIFVRPTPASKKHPALRIDDFELSLRELSDYREGGGSLIVDAQPVGAGRDAEMLHSLSERSGVHIIASTGYHLLDFYPENSWLHELDEDALRALYLSELREGMLHWSPGHYEPDGRTKYRAGIVKAAIPAEGATGRYETLLRAAARAAADGGVPLMLHTEYGAEAERAIDLCLSAGLRPEKIVICHADRQAEDFSIHERIAARGVYLDYDTIGRFKYHSDEAEISLLRHMWDLGCGNRILPSLDTTAARLSSYGGEIGLRYLLDEFYPRLRGEGFGEQQLEQFSTLNFTELFCN